MPVREVEIVNPLGLHMRPAAEFVKTANRFRSTVTVHKGDQKVNGKIITELMLLEAMPGVVLRLESDGEDAEDCLDALTRVVANFDKDNDRSDAASQSYGNA